MRKVLRCFYLKDYLILLHFDDSSFKIVDLSDVLFGPVFSPLKNKHLFSQVLVEGSSIIWPTGADLCPDMLYKKGIDLNLEYYNTQEYKDMLSNTMEAILKSLKG